MDGAAGPQGSAQDARSNRQDADFAPSKQMSRLLVVLGSVLILLGLLWPWVRRLPLFHLPGDVVIDRPHFKFFFPITTMLIVSLVLSVLAWIFRR